MNFEQFLTAAFSVIVWLWCSVMQINLVAWLTFSQRQFRTRLRPVCIVAVRFLCDGTPCWPKLHNSANLVFIKSSIDIHCFRIFKVPFSFRFLNLVVWRRCAPKQQNVISFYAHAIRNLHCTVEKENLPDRGDVNYFFSLCFFWTGPYPITFDSVLFLLPFVI